METMQLHESSWKQVLKEECNKTYFKELTHFVQAEYSRKEIFPPESLIFNAFDQCPFDKVKVVIIGQDPYHDRGQAHGLCFSVNEGVKSPPSLVNIYKELERDLGIKHSESRDLTPWAQQGVLLLNATLTVEAHQAGSHQGKGWELFTDAVIQLLNNEKKNLVFMLWGASAQKKGKVIDTHKHLVLTTAHPSPLSVYRGFIGCGHFSAANRYLINNGLPEIEW